MSILGEWERIEVITDGKSNVYWWNAKTNSSSWIDPERLSLNYYHKRHAEDECKYMVFKPRKLRIAGKSVSMEDHPTLAVRRQELLESCFNILVSENEKYGKMKGNSKTAKSCEKDGMRIGVQGIFARIVWFELLNEAQTIGEVGNHNRDSIFPTVFVGDPAVKKEFLEFGRTEDQTNDIMNKVGRAMMAASEELIRMRKDLHAQPSTPLSTVIEYTKQIDNSKHRACYYDLSYQGCIRSIGEEHLQKLLRLYKIHTNPLATLDDRTFVSKLTFLFALTFTNLTLPLVYLSSYNVSIVSSVGMNRSRAPRMAIKWPSPILVSNTYAIRMIVASNALLPH
jgi:hypothetical protein